MRAVIQVEVGILYCVLTQLSIVTVFLTRTATTIRPSHTASWLSNLLVGFDLALQYRNLKTMLYWLAYPC